MRGGTLLDVEHAGWSTDAAEFEEQRRIDQAWAESAMRQNLSARAAMRQEWAEHFRRMIGVHEALAERNRRRLAQLIDGGGG